MQFINTAGHSTLVVLDPHTETVADAAGQPATFVTFEGSAIEGVLEVDAHGALVVRFADGRHAIAAWGYQGMVTDAAVAL